MKRVLLGGLLAGAGLMALSLSYGAAQAAPESLLPPGFDDPEPAPTPAPAPSPRAPAPSAPAVPGGSSAQQSPSVIGGSPVVQTLPSDGSGASVALPSGLPSLEQLENLDPDELDELLGLKPKFDIPPAAQRSLAQVGLLGTGEGGLPLGSLGNQPASIVRAALEGTRGPLVSRWGHILLRRALASRLASPSGMEPAEFAGLRAGVLNRMGEHEVARAIAQDVDTGNWSEGLANEAITAFVATGDVTGACPLVRFRGDLRDDSEWMLLRAICRAYSGETARARNNLIQMRRNGDVAEIDVLLAQRFAGAAGRGRSAVNLEWEGVEELTPWRFGLATALGAELPEGLTSDLGPYYQRIAARAPAMPIPARLVGAERAAREGILSSAAMVDLLSQYYAQEGTAGEYGALAVRLRDAYVSPEPSARMGAIRDIWGAPTTADYSRKVLTAFAAARMPASEDFGDDAAGLIASMLAAGLDRDALEWGSVVPEGSEGWALLVLAQPDRNAPIEQGPVSSFAGDDESEGQRKTAFLVAGLAGLGRLETTARDEFNEDLGLDLDRATRWSRLISNAADVRNQALVAFLAGVGMQGEGWDKMTPRHLYNIVRALDQVGLSAEARMIAAEAVARG